MEAVTIFDLDAIEKQSIRAFLESVKWKGQVLDYGCGQQPYQDYIEACGADYAAYDRKDFGGNVSQRDLGDGSLLEHKWDIVLSTQAVQYVPDPSTWLTHIRRRMLTEGGLLVLTYPATWPVIRNELWHFTREGMELLLRTAGFSVLRHELRAAIPMDGFELPIGYGAVARA